MFRWSAWPRRLLFAVLFICTFQGNALAQEGQSLDAAAEALFLEGRRLYAERRYAEACKKFEDSHRLDPALGTALNLARCQATIGRTATAWALYRKAAARARELGQSQRERFAWQEAALLEPKLARLAIETDSRFSSTRPEVRLDGTPVPAGVVGGTIPVDPGRHRVSAHFQSSEFWSTEIETPEGMLTRVVIPYLEHAVADRAGPRPLVEQGTGEPRRDTELWRDVPRSKVGEPGLGTSSIVAIVLSGVAVLAAGYGTTAAILAKDKYDDSRATPDRAERLKKNDQAFDLAHQADLGFVVAGSALLGAGVLWLSTPPGDSAGPGSSAPDASMPVLANSAGRGAMATVEYHW